jgi:glutamine---fructose-6-phosphate transaminase (isomerizing)
MSGWWRRLAGCRLPLLRVRYGLGCGVIGLVCARRSPRLGEVASRLLRILEYRGYDSTGGVFQDGDQITLLKAPGAPSEVCVRLGMPAQAGSIFCGQVRWATYGAVDELNAQPHRVDCVLPLYGAHNGNVSNSPELKVRLQALGHELLSDNDGEVLVHLVEHHARLQLDGGETDLDRAVRRGIVAAARELEGSYAAVIVVPATGTSFAIKSGSSLYAGLGETLDGEGNPFFVVSSDLTAVLGLTRMLLPLRRGQVVEYTASRFQVWALVDQELETELGERIAVPAGEPIETRPRFSRLQVDQIALREPYAYFMEQEIADEVDSARRLVRYLSLGSPRLQRYRERAEGSRLLQTAMEDTLSALSLAEHTAALKKACERLFADDAIWELFRELPEILGEEGRFYSDAAGVLSWAWEHYHGHPRRSLLLLADLFHENDEINELTTQLMRFVDEARRCLEAGGEIYAVCSGTSYNAARTGALYFNDLCGVKFVPLLPGEYRGQYNHSIESRDLLLTISQSGETKDVIDVVDDLKLKVPALRHISLVNNLNSTLAQEKADVAIPLRCGPEIAVPATKSFINQLTMLYGMALFLAASRGGRRDNGEQRRQFQIILKRRERLEQIPEILERTLDSSAAQVELAAEWLHLAPSLHILATRMWGVAREGALKIREVVLNHAEGIEATEFKHGPNTILGLNTGFGLDQVRDFVAAVTAQAAAELQSGAPGPGVDPAAWLADYGRGLFHTGDASGPGGPVCTGISAASHLSAQTGVFAHLYRDYPLIYVTGPGKRDVELTITQINTHKIRGATTIVIAEPHPALERAACEAPMGRPDYRGLLIPLPRTGDLIATTFSSILVLQRLALRMCLKKMELLDRLGVRDHGVHPDAPKNVSKSITVD